MIIARAFLLLALVHFAAAAAPETRGPWRLELLAEAPAIRHPSVVCAAPDGRILVAEDPMDISAPASARQGRIICFHPDGRRTVYAENLYAVFGLQYLEGKVYVLHNPKFSVFNDTGDKGEWIENLIESTNPNPWALDWNDHVPANFKLAMDGYFYVAVGDKGIYGAEGKDGRKIFLHGGGIIRLRPDGTGLEVFCTGVRNIMDVALTSDDEIFTYDNTDEHNWMGRLTHMVEGGFYGYPYDFVPRRPYTLWMMHDFGGGAATGTFAYTEDALPAEYHDNLFLADFGKRQILRVVIAREGATFKVVRHEELFANVPDDFRPVGITLSADGKSILICDWQHRDTKASVEVGRLWKLTYNGKTEASKRPNWFLPLALGKSANASNEALTRGLEHKAKSVRLAAARELRKRNQRVPWRRDEIGHLRQELRTDGASNLENFLDHPDASVRFHAATAHGRAGRYAGHLITRLAEPDPFVRHALERAINRIGRRDPSAWRAVVEALPRHTNAAFALRETWDLTLLSDLERFVRDERRPVQARLEALRLAGAMTRKFPEWKGEWWAYHPALAAPPKKTVAWEGTDRAIDLLAENAESRAPDLRLAAYELIGAIEERSLGRLLRVRFDAESSTAARQAILRALALLRDPETSALISRVLTAELSDLTLHAVRAAEHCSGFGARETLVKLLARKIDPDLRAEAIRVLGVLGEKSATTPIVQALQSSQNNVRIAAIVALSKLSDPSTVPDLLAAWRAAETREAAQDALFNIPDLRALEVYENALASASPAVRDRARQAITRIKDQAWPLLKDRVQTMKPVAVAELRKIYPDLPQEAEPPAPEEYARFALANRGDALRGEKIFFNEAGLACSKCHTVGSRGTAVGPDLSNIGGQFPRAALIEHILTPSKAVREGYQQVQIETAEDESFSGLIKAETADALTILDGQAKLHQIPKNKITRRQSSQLSLMPEGLHAGLSLEEFADLIAYLESLKEAR